MKRFIILFFSLLLIGASISHASKPIDLTSKNDEQPKAILRDYDYYYNHPDGAISGCYILSTGQTLCDTWYPW